MLLNLPIENLYQVVSFLGSGATYRRDATALALTCRALVPRAPDFRGLSLMISPSYGAYVHHGPRSWIGPQCTREILCAIDFDAKKCAIAGSYALHSYMRETQQHWPSWSPGDIDVFLADAGDPHWCYNLVKRAFDFCSSLRAMGIQAKILNLELRNESSKDNTTSFFAWKACKCFLQYYDRNNPSTLKIRAAGYDQNTSAEPTEGPFGEAYYPLIDKPERDLKIVNVSVSMDKYTDSYAFYTKISFISSRLIQPEGFESVSDLIAANFDISVCKVLMVPRGRRATYHLSGETRRHIDERVLSARMTRGNSEIAAQQLVDRCLKYRKRGFKTVNPEVFSPYLDGVLVDPDDVEMLSVRGPTFWFCKHDSPYSRLFRMTRKPLAEYRDHPNEKYTDEMVIRYAKTCSRCQVEVAWFIMLGHIRMRSLVRQRALKLRVLRRLLTPVHAFRRFKIQVKCFHWAILGYSMNTSSWSDTIRRLGNNQMRTFPDFNVA